MWISVIYIGLFKQYYGVLITLALLPIVPNIFRLCQPGEVKSVEECGKFQTLFGVLLAIGIAFS